MSASPEFFALQQAVAGRYSIVSEIGRGGMGIVFLARDVALDRPVAIKMLPVELAGDAGHRDRFVREARIAAGLSHPNIVPIHAVEAHPGVVFFVMSYVDGETLAARVARHGPLPVSDALRVIQETAWALGHAHAHGVVHRDMKPENILLERGSGRALVTDFGIARRDDTMESSGAQRIAGTPRYMSPEQGTGGTVDARADVYALGAVAHFALTGRAPYDAATAMAILRLHASAPIPDVRAPRPDVPATAADAITRCLAKDPVDRFRTADELAVALQPSADSAVIPQPVREFIRESHDAASELATLVTAGGMAAAGWAQSLIGSEALFGFLDTVLYGGIASALTGLAVIRVGQLAAAARELLRSGYGFQAVKSASLVHERRPSRPAGTPWRAGEALVWLGATAFAYWLTERESFLPAFVGIAGFIALPTLYVRRLLQRRQGESWLSRALRGRLGRWLFRAAGWRAGGRAAPLGEPTALALGGEIADLFSALPPEHRRAAADLPRLVARLEDDAVALRARGQDERSRRLLGNTVAALEALRLDLLRLHADVGHVPDLTMHLDAARRIGEELDQAPR